MPCSSVRRATPWRRRGKKYAPPRLLSRSWMGLMRGEAVDAGGLLQGSRSSRQGAHSSRPDESARSDALMALQNGRSGLHELLAFKNDKELVMAAVQQQGLALQHASAALQGDVEVVLAAVKQNGLAIRLACRSLRSDDGIILAAVMQNGLALEHARPSTCNGWAITVAAVMQCGSALQFAPSGLRDSIELVLLAVQQDPTALQHASVRVRNLLSAAVGSEDHLGAFGDEAQLSTTESTASEVGSSIGESTDESCADALAVSCMLHMATAYGARKSSAEKAAKSRRCFGASSRRRQVNSPWDP